MTWFNMMSPESGDVHKIEIIGPIGRTWYEDGGVDLQEFSDQLKAVSSSEIEVVISSGGGSYVVGAAIYNLLRSHPAKIVTRVLGEASSAATLPLLAGDERYAPENVIGLIHDPTMGVGGNYSSDELRKIADDQDTVKRAAMSIYIERTSLDSDALEKMMSDNTWLTGADMYEHGFVNNLDGPVEIAADSANAEASYNAVKYATEVDVLRSQMSALADENKMLKASSVEMMRAEEPMPAEDVVMMCSDAGLASISPEMVMRKPTKAAVSSAIADMKSVMSFCNAAKIPSEKLLSAVGKSPVEMAKAAVSEALAAADVDIQNHPDETRGGDDEERIDIKSLYANLNSNKLVRG